MTLSVRADSSRLLAASLAAASAIVLSACSSNDSPPVSSTAPAPVSAASTPTTSQSTSLSTTETSSSNSETPSSSSSRSTVNSAVAETQKKFGTLAPDTLFAQFDTCDPNGVEDSMACTGKDVGQFQFFASDAKAASTTQLLTGLRNSRVIKDTGRFVVGWSTLGNTAIITVVDNEEGLVMQQMVSTDEIDPTKRIHELGLAENADQAASKSSTEAEPTDAKN